MPSPPPPSRVRAPSSISPAPSTRVTSVSRRGTSTFAWDAGSTVDAGVKLANAQAKDLIEIAGQQHKLPLTGIANINAHVTGTFQNLNGNGNITLTNGVAYGENYQTISVDANVIGQQITASHVLIAAHGMQVTGNAAYNLASKRIAAHIQGNNFSSQKSTTSATPTPTPTAS